MNNRIKAAASLFLLMLSMLFWIPLPGNAFIGIGITGIISNVAIPFFVGVIATIAVHITLILKRVPQKVLLSISILSMIVLIVLGTHTYQRFIRLRAANQPLAIERTKPTLSESEAWEKYVTKVRENSPSGLADSFLITDGVYCSSPYARHISEIDSENQNAHHVLDISCLPTNIDGTTDACELPWDLYAAYDDESKINEIMQQYDVEKGDTVSIICQSGLRSSHLAFILQHYGYDAYFGGLADFDELTFDSGAQLSDFAVFIDEFKPQKNDSYLYLLLREYDSALFDSGARINLKPYLNNFSVINTENFFINPETSNAFNDYTTNISALPPETLNNSKIVCLDKLHCFLTRLYLTEHSFQDYDKIYCAHCADTISIQYCEN